MKLLEQFEISCQTSIFSIPIYTPNYTPLLYPLLFPHRELKLSLQRLLRTFRSQQRYLEVSPRFNDEFGTVFEAIQIILEPVLDVKLRQRQNHSVDHGSTNILYTPKKPPFA